MKTTIYCIITTEYFSGSMKKYYLIELVYEKIDEFKYYTPLQYSEISNSKLHKKYFDEKLKFLVGRTYEFKVNFKLNNEYDTFIGWHIPKHKFKELFRMNKLMLVK